MLVYQLIQASHKNYKDGRKLVFSKMIYENLGYVFYPRRCKSFVLEKLKMEELVRNSVFEKH